MLERFASVAKSLAWPGVVLVALAVFASPLRDLLGGDVEEFTLSAPGVTIHAKLSERKEAAAASLEKSRMPWKVPIQPLLNRLVTPQISTKLVRSLVLWMDDCPKNNVPERQAFEAFGTHFVISPNLASAEAQLTWSSVDLVLTDLNHRGCRGSEAGGGEAFALLRWMQDQRPAELLPPVIVYTTKENAQDARSEARMLGAFGITGFRDELFALVVKALEE